MNIKNIFKRTLIVAICFMAGQIVTSCKKEALSEGYTVAGTVKGLDQGMIKLIESDFTGRGAEPKVIDSVQMVNGAFEFIGNIEHPDQMLILIGDKYNSSFFLENSAITLEFDIADSDRGQLKAKVTGSSLQEVYDVQQEKLDSILKQKKYEPLVALRTEMEAAYGSKEEEKIKAYQIKAEKLNNLQLERIKEQKDFMIQYVTNHPESPVSPWVLGFQFSEGRMSKEEMKRIYPIFKGAAKQTAMFKYYKKTYDDIFKNLGEGAIAPDFKLNDVNGKEIKLSEVKAKYKLVDFWASWCVPCRASFPHLKELYKKYEKDGFEVVGIGTADEEEKWKKAIKEDQTPWMHLYDSSTEHEWGIVARLYGVPFLPTTFLMDADGKSILRNPEKKDLDAKLAELFGH